MNDASQRGIFAIFAILAISGGLAYAAAPGAGQSPSPVLAQAVPSGAPFKLDPRRNDAIALGGGYGCATEHLPNPAGGPDAAVLAVSDCD